MTLGKTFKKKERKTKRERKRFFSDLKFPKFHMKWKIGKKNRQMKKNEKEKKRTLTLSKRLLMLCLLPMLLACLAITIFSTSRLRSGMEAEIEKSLEIVASCVNETYTNLYEGDYSQNKNGKLKKGDTTISGENALIDSLKEKTGFEVSFLYGNMRLITTLRKENGARINGTGIDSTSYNRILEGTSFFVKEYEVSGGKYYVYYQPLINSDGTVIGAIETAVETASINKTINSQVIGIVGFSVVFVGLTAVAVVLLSKSMVQGMSAVKHHLQRIVHGHLDEKANEVWQKRDDEIGDIYRMAVRLQNTLYQIVTDIKQSVDRLNESAGQLTDMAQTTNDVVDGVISYVSDISQGAQQQAEDTSETNHNVMRMEQQIEDIVGEVEVLNSHAARMAEEENESKRIINELDESSEETKQAVMQVAEQIVVMSSSIQGINVALDMIRNVADETTLLALNASIEAARVGEAGRGFAVVAQQINKLAEQSNSSIGKIEEVIGSVVSTSDRMVEIMDEVKEKMVQQQEKLDETLSCSVAVSDEVEVSRQKIEEIRHNVDTLNEFGNAIGEVISNLAAVSCENAASADNTREAANSMSITMNNLRQASERLVGLSGELEKTLELFKL